MKGHHMKLPRILFNCCLLLLSGCQSKSSQIAKENTFTYYFSNTYSVNERKQYAFENPARIDFRLPETKVDSSHIYPLEIYVGLFKDKIKDWKQYIPVIAIYGDMDEYSFSKELPAINQSEYAMDYSEDYTTDTYYLTYHRSFRIDIDFDYYLKKMGGSSGSISIGLTMFDTQSNQFYSKQNSYEERSIVSNKIKLKWSVHNSVFEVKRPEALLNCLMPQTSKGERL